jgi:hypothetical protein
MELRELDNIPSEIEIKGFKYVLIISRPDGKWHVRYMMREGWFCQTSLKRYESIEEAIEKLIEWLESEGIDCSNIKRTGG